MLHGAYLGSLASWYFTSAPALAQSHQVLLFDLRGHGRSERASSGYDLLTLSRDLASLIDPWVGRDDPLILVGHSYGALVALRFALDYPQRVRRLALVEAPLPPSQSGEMRHFMRQTPQEMLRALPPQLGAGWQEHSRRSQRLLQTLTFLSQQSTLLHDMEHEKDFSDAELASLTCPVLCAYGDRSSCLSAGKRLAAAVPRAELAVFSGGHYLHLDATAELTSRLVEFADG
jgi:pimeloyl-ACP methyl ester carboxylesterase